MVRDDTCFLSLVIPPDFMSAAGIPAKHKSCFPNFLDDIPIFKGPHAETTIGSIKIFATVFFC